MTWEQTSRAVGAGALVVLVALSGCSREAAHHHDEEHSEAEVFERGPHGGRWLEDGEFGLELVLFEAGAPPEFRAFVYRDEAPGDPSGIDLEVTLRRLGGRADRIHFTPHGDFLRGDRSVEQPHSFDVDVVARAGGQEHRFSFASYENRMNLTPDQVAAAGIEIATAAPATIREHVVLNGRINANEDALAHVMPRFPGVVRSVHKRLGDAVARGDLLAVIESNESLQPFELRAPLAGTVIAKDVAAGEVVASDRALFEIADLAAVWVDLDVYRRDFGKLRVGQAVHVDAGDGSAPATSTLHYLSPIGSPNTQTLLARAALPNPDRSWRPGLFVTAKIEIGATEVPVAVAAPALQRLGDRDVVFAAEGSVFEAQPVVTGRRDAERVEITAGLEAGRRYVAAGSFILKAEAGKSGAGHDH